MGQGRQGLKLDTYGVPTSTGVQGCSNTKSNKDNKEATAFPLRSVFFFLGRNRRLARATASVFIRLRAAELAAHFRRGEKEAAVGSRETRAEAVETVVRYWTLGDLQCPFFC